MINALWPGYSGLSSADLSEKFLDEASSDVNDLIRKEIQGHSTNSFTLLTDVWMNVKNKAIIAISNHTGETFLFIRYRLWKQHENSYILCTDYLRKY